MLRLEATTIKTDNRKAAIRIKSGHTCAAVFVRIMCNKIYTSDTYILCKSHKLLIST